MKVTALKLLGILVLLAAGVVFPHVFTSPLVMTIAIFTLIYATMAAGWNILGGYTGYISLGHAAFFGVGAYSLGLICQHWQISGGYGPFYLLPVAGLIAAAIATPVGWITLRTRRHVFVVLTIAMLFIGQLLATNLENVTGGSQGLGFPTPPWLGADFNPPFYYAALITLVCTTAVSWWIRQSKFGLGLLAIRDDEDRAMGLGVPTGPSKLIVFVIAAFFIGIAGAIYGYFVTFLYPSFAFNPLDDLAMVLMTFTGGLGTLAGPIMGAFLIEPLHEYFTFEYGASGLYLILYGALFLVVILLMPLGIIPTLTGLRSKWTPSWRKRPEVAPTPREEPGIEREVASR